MLGDVSVPYGLTRNVYDSVAAMFEMMIASLVATVIAPTTIPAGSNTSMWM